MVAISTIMEPQVRDLLFHSSFLIDFESSCFRPGAGEDFTASSETEPSEGS